MYLVSHLKSLSNFSNPVCTMLSSSMWSQTTRPIASLTGLFKATFYFSFHLVLNYFYHPQGLRPKGCHPVTLSQTDINTSFSIRITVFGWITCNRGILPSSICLHSITFSTTPQVIICKYLVLNWSFITQPDKHSYIIDVHRINTYHAAKHIIDNAITI